MPAARALAILQPGGSADSLDPTTVIVDTRRAGGVRSSAGAVARLTRLLHADREVASVSTAVSDPAGRYLRIDAVTRHDPASQEAQAFADRLRMRLIPLARFPASTTVIAGGGGAYAADFVSRTLGSFPWLILGVLGLTYLLLVRAFRSLLLPLKAIALNLLTVAAAAGLMIAVFQWGWGSRAGLLQVNQIEGWIPVFMFTLLFGLSMDYEVFLVSRMREAWDRTRSNTGAVIEGLANTGRIVTAAGSDHGRDVQRHGARLDPDHAATRVRARGRDHDRYHAHPRGAPPLDDGPRRPLELVPPGLGGSSSALDRTVGEDVRSVALGMTRPGRR